MADRLTAFFLPVGPGNRFCIYHPAVHNGSPDRGIVYVHPFGEEMNKARRMAALQSRRLAAAGYAVLQIDLYGCGDSDGDFGDATWDAWRADVRAAVAWISERMPEPVSLWGLRLGATLAADLAREPELHVDRLVLWQPVASGEQFLAQFLRLHLAAEMLAEGAAQTGVRDLRAALARGESLEIGGYELHPELASAIESLKLAELVPAVKTVQWLDVSAQPEPRLSPASQRAVEAWRAKGLAVQAAAVTGEPFWATPEITDCKTLLEATDGLLSHG